LKKQIFILAVFILSLSLQALAQQQFSIPQLKDDLLFYKSKLEQYHPNLYLYTSQEKLSIFFDSLSHSISSPLGEAEFYKIITKTSSIVKDGHTLILPSNNFIEYHNANSKFLPFQIDLYHHNLYVKMNCLNENILEDGTLIDSINGVSSKCIIESLLNRQVRDGENLSYAEWILDSYFREYYSYIFGHPNTFRISFKKDNNSTVVQTPGLLKDSIYYYRQKNYSHLYPEGIHKKGIYLNYDTTKQIAILTIKDFHSDILKNEYKQNFKKEIKASLKDVIESSAKNLVIDLRNNQGGDVENGTFLLKYLISKPFKVVKEYKKVKNGSLSKDKGSSMGIHSPNKKQFKGQIYVLLNGGSFSNSVIFASCLKENTNTIFVGTESGGNPDVLAGYAKDFELPNTKINIQVPTKRFIMTSLTKSTGSGLIPTYEIENSAKDIINQNDNQLDFLINLIQKSEN
jgi:hypothetical protein